MPDSRFSESRLNSPNRAMSHQIRMHPFTRLSAVMAGAVASTVALLLSGCVMPGYPYYGVPSAGALLPGTVPVCQPGIEEVDVLPCSYAPAQIMVEPTFYPGWGTGYWYESRFWPYRSNCGFWNGRYYNGYHWRNGDADWQGAYHGGQAYYNQRLKRYVQFPPASPVPPSGQYPPTYPQRPPRQIQSQPPPIRVQAPSPVQHGQPGLPNRPPHPPNHGEPIHAPPVAKPSTKPLPAGKVMPPTGNGITAPGV